MLRLLAIAGTGLCLAPTHALPQPRRAPDVWANLAAAGASLDAAEGEAGFSGVVLIGRDGGIVLQRACGLADAERSVFRIGSLTKPITASAVLVAVDRGVLSLDARACDLLRLARAAVLRPQDATTTPAASMGSPAISPISRTKD